MGLLHGKTAAIYWDSQGTDTAMTLGQNWSLDATQDIAEITVMADTYKTFIGGFQDWAATVTCLLDSGGIKIDFATGDPNGMGDVAARLELYLLWDTTTPYYRDLYGDCVCTGISPSTDKDGIVAITYTFQGTATLVWHAAATRP